MPPVRTPKAQKREADKLNRLNGSSPPESPPAPEPSPPTSMLLTAIPESEPSGRVLIYATEESTVYAGRNVLTIEKAKFFLGWVEETDTDKFGSDYHLIDWTGKKIRLTKNNHNRWLTESWYLTLAQEHLRRRWRLNGEPIIIGKYGEIISGQHRLVSLIIAEQIRLKDREGAGHWIMNWPDEVTMRTVVTTGIDESDDVVNTVDTGMRRSETHMLYRSAHFADLPPSERKAYANAASAAIRLLWERTGRKGDGWAPDRTHSELEAFLSLHPGIKRAIRHVLTENQNKRISKLIPLGYAAGLMYLMAAGRSDMELYKSDDDPNEKRVDFSLWDKAEEFWALIGEAPDFQEVRYALAALTNPENGEKNANIRDTIAVIIKAWRVFADGFPFKNKDARLVLSFAIIKGVKRMTENPFPTCGGIDIGKADDPPPALSGSQPPGQTTDLASAYEPADEERAEVERIKSEIQDETVSRQAAAKESGKTLSDVVASARRSYPGRLVLFKTKAGIRGWGKDADTLQRVIGTNPDPKWKVDGLPYFQFQADQLEPVVTQLVKIKTHVVLLDPTGSLLTDYGSRLDEAASKKPKS